MSFRDETDTIGVVAGGLVGLDMDIEEAIKSGIFGVVVGDALGVPVEFTMFSA